LDGANLSGANLYGATLNESSFQDADLSGTDLRNANLRDAHLAGVNLSQAKYNQETEWDADFHPPSVGAVKERRMFGFIEKKFQAFLQRKGPTRFNE
jgi:uncharacterized protein YjbI with pentapeptide repeats